LTYVAWDHYTHELEAKGITPEHILKAEEIEASRGKPPAPPADDSVALVAADEEGYEIYKKASCVSCHGQTLDGNNGSMPVLLGIGDKHDKEALLDIIHNGYGNGMQGQLQANLDKGLTEQDLETLADWLSRQKAE